MPPGRATPLNFDQLWNGEGDIEGLKEGIQFMGIPDDNGGPGLIAQQLHRMGLPASIDLPEQGYPDAWGKCVRWERSPCARPTVYEELSIFFAIISSDGIICYDGRIRFCRKS